MGLPPHRMTEAEYLAYDLAHEGKHEYYAGELVAMSGASLVHVRITRNLMHALMRRLEGKACEPLGSDMRVRVPDTDAYVYPDLTVVCGEPRTLSTKPETLLNPTLVFEVLSDSTEEHDRGAKAAHYRHIESLAAYVLVSTRERRVQVYERQADGKWGFTEAAGDAEILLPAVGFALPLAEIYMRVELPIRTLDPTPR